MMERLTYRDENGKAWANIKNNYTAREAQEFGRIALEQLAAYEDSRLSAAEVQELSKAKEEGRLVVLPCKVGDRVYSIYGYLNKSIQEDTVKHICVQDGEIRLTMDNTCTKIWGRSAFATREEAEKALEVRE